jgi:hypothetical protein
MFSLPQANKLAIKIDIYKTGGLWAACLILYLKFLYPHLRVGNELTRMDREIAH